MLRCCLLGLATVFLICHCHTGRLEAAGNKAVLPVASVDAVTDDGALELSDGRLVCLAGISMPPSVDNDRALKGWRKSVSALIGERDVRVTEISTLPFDRYGCLAAWVDMADGVSLQLELLAKGLAAVRLSPAFDDETRLDAMFALEDQARKARLGIWGKALAATVQAADSAARIGHRQIVEGRVQRVSDNDRYVYLNFGADWRTDFTARLHRKQVDRDGLDPQEFRGKRLRVRGFVQESRGPLIDVSHPKQIEILP